MPTPLLPDATVIARLALLAQTPVTARVGTRVLFAIPPTWPTSADNDLELIVLRLVDEDELRPETLTVRVQADCWGSGGSNQNVIDSRTTAATLRSVARDLNGDWTGGRIRNCVAGQIVPAPDPTTGRSRHVVDLLFELNS